MTFVARRDAWTSRVEYIERSCEPRAASSRRDDFVRRARCERVAVHCDRDLHLARSRVSVRVHGEFSRKLEDTSPFAHRRHVEVMFDSRIFSIESVSPRRVSPPATGDDAGDDAGDDERSTSRRRHVRPMVWDGGRVGRHDIDERGELNETGSSRLLRHAVHE